VKQIDRVTPTFRPPRTAIMHQRWAELGFLHWPVPVAALRGLVPDALTIDTYEGQAYVGVIPFTVTGARPMLMPPLPWVSDFHEVNVRTYVHLDGADPGVWFFSLDASNPVMVAAARALFRLPYHHARMEMDVDAGGVDFRSERASLESAVFAARYEPLGRAEAPAVGSLEYFLAERYLLYTTADRRLWQAQVHHEPYPLQGARVEVMVEGLVDAAGIARPEGQPPLAHFAREVHVEIFALRDVGGA
jgi:uncharacterized protein YqjF (DUF2071 family)